MNKTKAISLVRNMLIEEKEYGVIEFEFGVDYVKALECLINEEKV